jgi:hypothetical protein
MKFEQIAGIAVAVIVAGGVAAGFAVTGSPGHQRAVQLDEGRVDDLRSLSARIDERYGGPKGPHGLPARLARSDRPGRADGSDGGLDPISGQPYGYTREDAGHYRLCATFATTVKAADQSDGYWPHPSGLTCWRFDVVVPIARWSSEPPEIIR